MPSCALIGVSAVIKLIHNYIEMRYSLQTRKIAPCPDSKHVDADD